MEGFKALTLSYKNAPVSVRDKVSLSESQIKSLYLKIKDLIPVSEILIVSTCNRTEMYYTSSEIHDTELVNLLLHEKEIFETAEFQKYFSPIHDHQEAILHLFNVSIGLESQVVGDIQIINQIKNAYQWCADSQFAGAFLHRLLHTIFYCNKRVVQETRFRDGAASVSYATVDMMSGLVVNPSNAKVLLVGLGEIGADVASNLADSKFENITLVNRTSAKAEEMAVKYGFKFASIDNLWAEIAHADIIVSSVAVPDPIITHHTLQSLDINTHKFFFDLSIPRSIEPQIEKIPGVLLYNVDNIQAKANEALEMRLNAVVDVKNIIAAAMEEFEVWEKEMEVSPTIQKIKNSLEQIRKEEMARFSKQLTESESQKIEAITKNIMQKIIKLPVLQLKAACKRGEAESLADILSDLFDLEKSKVDAK
ncbi:MAG: glutamyl-tRNA reductase [Cytophagales bacterium]